MCLDSCLSVSGRHASFFPHQVASLKRRARPDVKTMTEKIAKRGTNATHRTGIRVGVGYGWMKVDEKAPQNGRAVLADVFWKTIQKAFEAKHPGFEKSNQAKVDFSRLRASHGKIIWTSVLERIRNSDILIFDVAMSPEAPALAGKELSGQTLQQIVSEMAKGGNIFNANVLIEIGVAIALDKRIMLLCPEKWRQFLPSDLKGYMWTFYNWGGNGKEIKRCFVDEYGMQNGYIGMLREVLDEKQKQEKREKKD